jgi:hypothetical protein
VFADEIKCEMDWSSHDRWAEKLGVPGDVSREVNEIIDAVEGGKKVSQEYRELLEQCSSKEYADSSGSAFDIVAANYSARKHDASRGSTTGGDVAANLHRCAMTRMGDDYLKAWRLHHCLDYLSERGGSDNRLTELLPQYQDEYPVIHSDEITEFVRDHRSELAGEVSLKE